MHKVSCIYISFQNKALLSEGIIVFDSINKEFSFDQEDEIEVAFSKCPVLFTEFNDGKR
jgi:hypothetical protein